MKYFLYIMLILIVLVVGINIGSEDTQNKAENIQNKIDEFENNITNNNDTYSHIIEPNIFNKLAEKCNNGLDSLIDKVLKKLVN